MRSLFIIAMMCLSIVSGCASTVPEAGEATTRPVVFVCEHGNVKSLIGAILFDQVARQRKLPLRAESRGVSPESSVPPNIINALQAEGVEVTSFKPRALSRSDMENASRIVAIGVDLSAFQVEGSARIEQWDDVPPASVDYAAARAALLQHIHSLVDGLTTAR